MDKIDGSMKVKWNKVADIKYVTDAFSGILAVGESGICNPIEGLSFFNNTGFLACAPYFNGDILIAENTVIIETYESKNESKWPYDIFDVATIGTITYIISRYGDIFYSTEFGKFAKASSKYEKFNSINMCDPYFVISGSNVIVINDSRESHRETFINVAIKDFDFKSAYVYDKCRLVALTTDGKLLYMPNFADMSKIYTTDITKLIQFDINNIYVHNTNLYLLCNNGFIALIKSFELSDSDNELEIYAAKFAETNWISMLHINDNTDRTVVVGNGRLDKSVLKIVNFDRCIIENDILNTNIVKRSYTHLATMMDSYENGCVMYTFYGVRPSIDVLDNKYIISLRTLLTSKMMIEDPDQLDKIDWSKGSIYVVITDPDKRDVLYNWDVDDNGILSISLDKFTNGLVNILLMLRGDKHE